MGTEFHFFLALFDMLILVVLLVLCFLTVSVCSILGFTKLTQFMLLFGFSINVDITSRLCSEQMRSWTSVGYEVLTI